MHEFFSRVGGVNQKFSEQLLYDETKKIDPQPNGCGTWVAYAIKVLAQLGQCRAVIWAYNPNLPCTHNGVEPPTAKPDAAHFKCSPVMLVNPHDVQGIKSALAGNSNVAFSIPVYNSWYRSPAVYASGRITMRVGTEPGAGGHAMCLVGYQDDQATPGGGYFILRNSWGNGFGTQCPYGIGYGTIPYQYIANDCWEAGFVRPVKPLA
jgi:hypothetical protein